MINFKIIGTGSYLPEKKETVNDFLAMGAKQDTIDRWGVYEHRVMGEDETVIDMEVEAAERALKNAGISANEIDLIISSTAVPHQSGVPNSSAIQGRIDAKNAASFDIVLACASSIPQIITAANYIALKQYRYVLITGASNASRFSDPTDPACYVVLGDGAGAMIIGPSDDDHGIVSFDLQTRGEFYDYCGYKVKRPKYESSEYSEEKLYFYIGDVDSSADADKVKEYLVSSVPATVRKSLEKANITINDVDMLISHQNINVLSGKWIEKIGIDDSKVHLTYSKYGNMTNANIFINLDEALHMNKIKKGDIVVFAGQGAGFSVGSIVMKW